MKKSTYLFIVLNLISLSFTTNLSHSESAELPWEDDFEHALALSKETGKPLLVFFTGSDWCPPCKMLEEDFFESEEFKETTKDLILYKADFPRRRDLVSPKQKKKNAEIQSKYGVKGYPTIIVLNGNGHITDRQIGYSRTTGVDEHFKLLDRVLR